MEKQKKPQSKFRVLLDTWAAQVVFGVVALAASYVFASWAIDTGSLLDYGITVLLLVAGVQAFVRALQEVRRIKKG